jgi:hypothetical protein
MATCLLSCYGSYGLLRVQRHHPLHHRLPKRKKFDSSNKYNYNNRNDSSDKGEGKKKYRFGDKKKKKFYKMMS